MKKKTRSQLTKDLDKVFSQFIRLRDEVEGCVTCGIVKPYKEMQCGHFYGRAHLHTRWDEDNCHVQCYRCNCPLKGNYIVYTKYMIDRYGREFVDELEIKSKCLDKIPTTDIQDMIWTYKDKVQALLT